MAALPLCAVYFSSVPCFYSPPDFTSDSLALDISPSLSDTHAGLICCQLWRRGRGDQCGWEVKRMTWNQSIQNLHPNLVDVLRQQPRSNFEEHLKYIEIWKFSLGFYQKPLSKCRSVCNNTFMQRFATHTHKLSTFRMYFIRFVYRNFSVAFDLSTHISGSLGRLRHIWNPLLSPCGCNRQCSNKPQHICDKNHHIETFPFFSPLRPLFSSKCTIVCHR